MGGGGGGYDRPSDSEGSGGGSGDSSEDESSRVPPPESEDETTENQSDEPTGTSDGATPGGSPATGGGGGGAPVTGPGGGSEDGPGDDDLGSKEEEPEDPEENAGQNDKGSNGQDSPDSGSVDESSEDDSKSVEEEGDQQNGNEGAEEGLGQESDEEDAENDDEDQEEDDENQEEDDEDDEDECLITETALLHSPNPEPLGDATEGDIYSVRLQEEVVCVVDSKGRTIGAIAEPRVGTLKVCIQQGRQYRARILEIDGGKCKVRVTNRCLFNRDIDLTAINTAVRDQLHPGLSLSVETTAEDGVVVMNEGSRVGDVPEPWAQLLDECIEQGRSYRAEIRDITPEYCTVNVQNDPGDE